MEYNGTQWIVRAKQLNNENIEDVAPPPRGQVAPWESGRVKETSKRGLKQLKLVALWQGNRQFIAPQLHCLP